MATDRQSGRKVLTRVLAQARPQWLGILGVFLLDMLATPLALLSPVPLKIAIDSVVGADPLPDIVKPIVPHIISTSNRNLLIFAVFNPYANTRADTGSG